MSTSSFAIRDSTFVDLGRVADKLCEAADPLRVEFYNEFRLQENPRVNKGQASLPQTPLLSVQQDAYGSDDVVSVSIHAHLDTRTGETSALDDELVRKEISNLSSIMCNDPTVTLSTNAKQLDVSWLTPSSQGLEDGEFMSCGVSVAVTKLRMRFICSLAHSCALRVCIVNVLLPMIVSRARALGAFYPLVPLKHVFILSLSQSDAARFGSSMFFSRLLDEVTF